MSNVASSDRLTAAAVGLALMLGAATQLRVSAVGPGDVLLVIVWLAGMTRILGRTDTLPKVPLQGHYLMLLIVVLVWSWVGLAVGQWLQTTYESWPRQIAALGLALSVPLIVRTAWGDEVFVRAMGAMATFAIIFYGLAWLALVSGFDQLGPVELKRFDYRFVGFSSDPNQAALLISVAMMSALIAGLRLRWSKWRIGALIGCSIVLGRATDSDSFLVAFGFALLAGLGEFMLDRGRRLKPGATLLVVAVAIVGVATIFYGVYQGFDELYQKNNQGAVRLAIWSHGIEAFLAAPLTGHGPGHFSGILAPFVGAESHNLYIDWATQFGIVGLLVLLSLFLRTGVYLVRAREFTSLGMLAILSIMSIFLFFGRHAVFWSGLWLCFVMLARRPGEKAR